MNFFLKKTFIIILIICFCFSGCSSNRTVEIDIPDQAVIGVVYSAEEHEISRLDWLDSSLTHKGNSTIPYTNLGVSVGFQNTVYSGNSPILVSQSKDGDHVKVIKLDLKENNTQVYPYERINVTDWNADENHVVVTSNLNNEYFIDLLDLNTGSWNGFKLKESVHISSLVVVDQNIYAFAEDDHKSYLCECNISEEKVVNLLTLKNKEAPSHLSYMNSYLYFVDGDELVIYNIKDKKDERIKLTRKSEFYNLLATNQCLWIGYTDIHQEDSSLIEKRDIETGKLLSQGNYDGSIWVLEVDTDNLYVLGLNTVSSYRSNTNKLTKIKEIDIDGTKYSAIGIIKIN